MNKLSKNGAYDMLVAPKDAITKIMGIITPKSINTLKNELGGAFTILKSTHFTEGQHYGFLVSIITKAKYRIVINNSMWVYTAPANPGAYAATALRANVSKVQCEQIVMRHKEEQTSYADYLGGKNSCFMALETMHLRRRRGHPFNDTPPQGEDSDQDDGVTKIRVQVQGLQQTMGPHVKHHGLLHGPGQVPNLPCQLWHIYKHQRDEDGGMSEDVGV
jgi:hypothetical protein